MSSSKSTHDKSSISKTNSDTVKDVLSYKIKRINKIIRSASENYGYVCGRYVRNVLVPLSQSQQPEDIPNVISLRFPDHRCLMEFFVDKAIMITDTDTTPWNEPEYIFYIKGSRNDSIAYRATISPYDLTKDVDVNQLVATIEGEKNNIVFRSTDPLLTVQDLINNINKKCVKIRSICYKEALCYDMIYFMLESAIKGYKKESWTIDESEKPQNYEVLVQSHKQPM